MPPPCHLRPPHAQSSRRPDHEASASARRQGRVTKAAPPFAVNPDHATALPPSPFHRMRSLKLRAPDHATAAPPPLRRLPHAAAAPPGPRSFSERTSPRPRRQGRAAKAAPPFACRLPPARCARRQGRVAKAAPPFAVNPDHATAMPPSPFRRMRSLKLRAPDHATAMPPPLRRTPACRYAARRMPNPPAARTTKLQRAHVAKAASPRPRRLSPSIRTMPPPCHRPHSTACAR
jgi:hypothetical protein